MPDKRVIFVDDEASLLSGLKRMLRPMRQEWDMHFAGGGSAALEAFDQEPFDVIVSDMRMPGMDGAELLTKVRAKYPNTVRIVLSGQSDKETILRSIGPTHQFLSKPCDYETIIGTIKRSCALRSMLSDERLQSAVSEMETLPVMPEIYSEVLAALNNPNTNVEAIARKASKDPAISAKMLQLVNSSFFGVAQRITNVVQAISMLGLDTLKSIFFSVNLFEQFRSSQIGAEVMEQVWRQSENVGMLSQMIAKAEGLDKHGVEDSMLAGLVHQIGRLVLLSNDAESYISIQNQANAARKKTWQMEKEVLGYNYCEVGAYLLGLWGLPDDIVEAVAYFHQPSQLGPVTRTPLAMVHLAHVLAKHDPRNWACDLPGLDKEAVAVMNMKNRLEAWQESVLERQQNRNEDAA